MKKQIFHTAALLGILLLGNSCLKDDSTYTSADNGSVALQINATRAEAGSAYDPMSNLSVKFYNSDSKLIRKYTAKSEIPAELQLVAGSYSVAIEAGEQVKADFEKRYYVGNLEFDVVAKTVTPIEVNCKLQNIMAEVKFDETIATKFGTDYHVWVAAADAFNQTDATNGTVPALKYTSDATGYFTMPADVTSLVWHFEGTLNNEPVVKEGKLENVALGEKQVLTFKYSKDLPGYIELFVIRVDTDTEDFDDTIQFSPDPIINGEDFDIENPVDFIIGKSTPKTYTISTMEALRTAKVIVDGVTYDPMTTTIEGLTYTKVDNYNATLTLSESFFTGRNPGRYDLNIRVTDAAGADVIKTSTSRVQGLLPITTSDYNLWTNSVTLRAMVVEPGVASVNFAVRIADGTWRNDIAATTTGDGFYTATVAPEWVTTRNESNLTVHTLVKDTGIIPASSYEARVVFGTETLTTTFTTPAGNTIYNSGMENWSTYKVTGSTFTGGTVPTPNESGTAFWVSGNNKQASSLCTGGTIDGSNGTCAQLVPAAPMGYFAAGNLFTGTFELGTGFTDSFGFARFGAQYTYTARPRAMRVHFKAEVSTVTDAGKSSLQAGVDIDPARIFVTITNWTSRHSVQSGASSNVNTFWDPVKTSSLDEGAIIGYGSRMITTSTDGWVTEEIPINYYDQTAAPAAGNYSLVISCATSAYGDYMAGSTNNRLYVEDFEWVY